ncbi:MAG: aminotransferase class I/II-fold pyridoxal phosphate-dependent enzyme [Ignavibacteriales bacterium]|nr:aminotransferase class I/II-fold pyridoxal phosphate-dependent enzyme [Ignavibacteriales bacterium]
MKTENLKNIEQHYLMDSAPGAKTKINGKEYFYFGGTSYYELHKNEDVINSAINALKKYGINSSSSRSSYGTTQLLLEVEKEAAEFFNCEDAVYLSSGFLTDMAAVQAFINNNMFDAVFIDEISHYSNEYAAKLSGKPIYKFSHLDDNDLEEKIFQNLQPDQKPLVITDGIFPIFGKIAPIHKYSSIIEKYNGILWVDDAHALGILGPNGRGTYEHYGLTSERFYFGGTFSKAFGGFGGIIPGNKKFIEEIKNNQIQNGATPPPSSAAAASLTGLKLVKSKPEMKLKLWENAKRLKTGLKNLGIEVEDSNVPIAAWAMNSKSEMQKLQNELMKKNFVIQYIKYIGTGEKGALRIVVFSTHTFEQIDNLIYELKKII